MLFLLKLVLIGIMALWDLRQCLAYVDYLYPAMGLDIAPWCLKVLFIPCGMVTVMVVSF